MRVKPKNDDMFFRCPFCDGHHVYFVRFLNEFYCPSCFHIIWREDLEQKEPTVETESTPPATTLPRGGKRRS